MKMSFFEPSLFWYKFYWMILISLMPALVVLLLVDPIKEIIALWGLAAGWSGIGILMCDKYISRKDKSSEKD